MDFLVTAQTLRADPQAMACYAERTAEQSEWLDGLRSGLTEAVPALPGTGWEHACTAASDVVGRSVHQVAQALAGIAADVQVASVALEGADEQFQQGFTDCDDAVVSHDVG